MDSENYTQEHHELKAQVAAFPKLPGVYLMRDEKQEVIYIGKAKDLRARVRTYFAGGDGRSQIEFLLKRVRTIEKIVTESETQAFVLERDLITKYKPRYNIRLKDDKAYLSVKIDEHSPWPRLELVRRIEKDGARYFGPYSFSYELKNLLEIIKRVVPLRTCRDTIFYNRQRPCLEYQIKRCLGPCCLSVDREQYGALVKQAISILEGKTDGLVKELSSSMERASEELRFEDAAVLRDRIETLKNFKSGQKHTSSRGEDRDVFAFYREAKLVTLSILKVRLGRISDSVNFVFSDVEIPDGEVLESVIGQYYESHGDDMPEEIVVPIEFENLSVLESVLKEKRGGKLEVLVPKLGIKARLIALAELNAREHFISTFDAETRYLETAKQMASMFRLKQMPRKIECVDISNFQGGDIVGAIVAFFDGSPDKESYRKYQISRQDKADDFGSIYEVVCRRLERGLEEGNLPDLLIIDGGLGQLHAALAAREHVKVPLEIISIAKMRTESDVEAQEVKTKPERIFIEGAQESIPLDEASEVTKFLQRVRDEVHRFVITYHRQKRSKRVIKSKLDEILGVGPERRRRLLAHFGSVDAMKSAEPAEIARIGRMPLPLALKIKRKIG